MKKKLLNVLQQMDNASLLETVALLYETLKGKLKKFIAAGDNPNDEVGRNIIDLMRAIIIIKKVPHDSLH